MPTPSKTKIQKTFTVAASDTETYYLPAGSVPVTVTVIPGSNTGLVQYTTSSESAAVAGTATWQNWAKGSVTSTASDTLLGPVTALKFSATGGSVTFEIVL
jgi:hypothetical protein